MSEFNETNTKELIKLCKKNKTEGKGLTSAFKDFSNKYGIAEGSVRNYYYKTVKTANKDNKLKRKLGITNELFPKFIEEFNNQEERELLYTVLNGLSKGRSVRNVILEISNSNGKLALRFQNKYRNLLIKKPNLVMETVQKINKESGRYFNPYNERKPKAENDLEKEINGLIERLLEPYIQENGLLKDKISRLEEKIFLMENGSKNKNVKDYFLDIRTKN